MFERFVDPSMTWEEASADTKDWLLRRVLGYFTTVPLGSDQSVDSHLAWHVRLTVTAEDVDAVTYKTRLRWHIRREDRIDERDLLAVGPVWDPLVRIRDQDWPGSIPDEVWGQVPGSLTQDEIWAVVDESYATHSSQLSLDDPGEDHREEDRQGGGPASTETE
jgi:hypothetical protein